MQFNLVFNTVHSERSEESVNISRKYKAHVIRLFTSFRMTRDRLKTTIKKRIFNFDTPPIFSVSLSRNQTEKVWIIRS